MTRDASYHKIQRQSVHFQNRLQIFSLEVSFEEHFSFHVLSITFIFQKEACIYSHMSSRPATLANAAAKSRRMPLMFTSRPVTSTSRCILPFHAAVWSILLDSVNSGCREVLQTTSYRLSLLLTFWKDAFSPKSQVPFILVHLSESRHPYRWSHQNSQLRGKSVILHLGTLFL